MGSKSEFSESLFQLKKEAFLSTVIKASKRLRLGFIPKVNFWESKQPCYTGTDWAHIHLDTKEICVNKKELTQMTMEKIYEVATHEVTHLVETEHGAMFTQKMTGLKVNIWTPPKRFGITVVGLPKQPGSRKLKDLPYDPSECNYYDCNRVHRIKCQYCGKSFCEEHIKPFSPKLWDPEDRKQLFSTRHDNGHPCLGLLNDNKTKHLEDEEEPEIEFHPTRPPEPVLPTLTSKEAKLISINILVNREPTKSFVKIKKKQEKEIFPLKELWTDNHGTFQLNLLPGEYLAELETPQVFGNKTSFVIEERSIQNSVYLLFRDYSPNYSKTNKDYIKPEGKQKSKESKGLGNKLKSFFGKISKH